jgi:predicted dehydrogenase
MLPVIASAPEFERRVGPWRRVRVAIVGLGRMGVAHAAVLAMIRDVAIAGAVDGQAAAVRRLRGLGFRMPVWPSLDALLGQTKIDAVWVCTPPDTHLAIARRCADARAAVFVEKPLAHTLADARALAALAAGSDRPIACGYTLAFWPSFVAARRLLEAGVLGPSRRATSSMVLSQVSRPQRGWMYDRSRAGGGVVANLSSHLLFVLRACFGMPTAVRATWRHVHSMVEDELRATIETPGCPTVEFESSWCVPGHPVSRTTMEVEGPNGTLRVDNDGLEIELHEPRGGLPAGRTTIPDAALPQPARFTLNGEAYSLEDAHFLRWVTGGPVPPITAAAGLEVQRIMEALYVSAAAGGERAPVPD